MHKKNTAFDVFNHFILLLFAFICVYPFYFLIIYSLSDSIEAARAPIWLLPRSFTIQSYAKLLLRKEIVNAAFISASRAVAGTVVTVFFSAMFAYLLTKRELVFRRLFYRMMIITMYLSAGLIPYYITMKTYGLNNNYLLYIIPGAVGPFFVILVKTYIEGLPISLEEAAKIDGAGYLMIFLRIILPVCTPVLAAIAVFSAVGQWNSWQDNFYLVRSRSLKTLQLQLLEYLQTMDSTLISDVNTAAQKAGQVSSLSIKTTISVITMIPIMLVYPFLQKYFIKGILIGSIKG